MTPDLRTAAQAVDDIYSRSEHIHDAMADLRAALDAPRPLFRHFKGAIYEVLCEAFREGDHLLLVIYRTPDGDGTTWARPAAEFYGDAEPGVKRFAPVDPAARAPAKCAHGPCVASANQSVGLVCDACRGWIERGPICTACTRAPDVTPPACVRCRDTGLVDVGGGFSVPCHGCNAAGKSCAPPGLPAIPTRVFADVTPPGAAGRCGVHGLTFMEHHPDADDFPERLACEWGIAGTPPAPDGGAKTMADIPCFCGRPKVHIDVQTQTGWRSGPCCGTTGDGNCCPVDGRSNWRTEPLPAPVVAKPRCNGRVDGWQCILSDGHAGDCLVMPTLTGSGDVGVGEPVEWGPWMPATHKTMGGDFALRCRGDEWRVRAKGLVQPVAAAYVRAEFSFSATPVVASVSGDDKARVEAFDRAAERAFVQRAHADDNPTHTGAMLPAEPGLTTGDDAHDAETFVRGWRAGREAAARECDAGSAPLTARIIRALPVPAREDSDGE